ncbi:23S rRNA methyltransferase protein [Mycoplasmopsis californica HAZ160_1]|uniref:23S rRNA methyltransferase protein n=1 Tax=Mycoplasmopsis californica HAZ160_1 TaxID=1397850 RepID=A0AAT9F9A9_9BACT|nr:23S rRNA (uracil(1939)-C(5))-methyltransferase RlmD [Mycoplasmopsis californica]BAP01294.1 23S rRNA methyltransferase protein [Mycoplasmopsis californica HAZ160_1]BBG42930.1 23S rRNA methyltransferase protein [Mycoplasmopsis californica]BBG43505.1 23S rRNA methyltransferase protein [Mycoplasmopsis californica]
MEFKKGQILKDVEATQLSYEGMGVVKIDNYSIFVENLLPGEKADIFIQKANNKFGFARCIKRVVLSPIRQEVINEALMDSGSTSLAMLPYEKQLEFKENFVTYLFGRNIHFEDVKKIIPNQKPWGYRNKLTVFVKVVNNVIKLGLYRKNTHDLVEQSSYDLAYSEINKVILWLQKNINKYYKIVRQGDLLESITFRFSQLENKMLVIFNVKNKMLFTESFIREFTSQNSNIKNIIVTWIDKKKMNYQTLIRDDASLKDLVGNVQINYGWNSFFQVNTQQANILYTTLIDNLSLTNEDVVVDAYSGAGSIALKIANKVKKVYGLEIINQAVLNAIQNAKLNGVDNAEFITGDVNITIFKVKEKVTTVIVDPPRAGLSSSFLATIVKMQPEKIGYISCNVHTMCRDVDLLQNNGYKLVFLQPCDMFSQTHHIELVGVLIRNKK